MKVRELGGDAILLTSVIPIDTPACHENSIDTANSIPLVCRWDADAFTGGSSSLTRGTSGDGIMVSGGALTVGGLSIGTQSGSYDLAQSGGTLTVLGCAYDLGKTNGSISRAIPAYRSLLVSVAVRPWQLMAIPTDCFSPPGDQYVYVWNEMSWARIDN